jgi:hypothetical protein
LKRQGSYRERLHTANLSNTGMGTPGERRRWPQIGRQGPREKKGKQ